MVQCGIGKNSFKNSWVDRIIRENSETRTVLMVQSIYEPVKKIQKTRNVFKKDRLCCMGFHKDMETKHFNDIFYLKIYQNNIKIYQNLDKKMIPFQTKRKRVVSLCLICILFQSRLIW